MMVKTKSSRCESGCQHNLNLDLSKQTKKKKSFFEYIFLKKLVTIITNKTPAKAKHSNYGP